MAEIPLEGSRLLVDDQVLEELADRVVERLAERNGEPEVWLNVEQAAAYLACKRQRIYDLVGMDRLSPARDGKRLLFRREWLDEVLDEAEPETS